MTKITSYVLQHLGSGPFGNSAYNNRRTGCLEYQRLSAQYPPSCEDIYTPSAGGKPSAMLVGSMVHAYIEMELKHGLEALPMKDEPPLVFEDHECDWDVPENAAVEAHRVFWGWVEVRENWGEGKTLGAELKLDEIVEGIRIQALIDHLVEDPDGVLCIEDFKTAAANRDTYTRGRTRLQMHLYVMAAWAAGYDVQRIRIRCIVKTKKVQEVLYETIDLPTPAREDWILRYLQAGLDREAQGPTGPWGAGCDFCIFQKNFLCKL